MTEYSGPADAQRRYALALALIPDRDEADDIFRLSRDEADLRRRAESWLAKRGLAVPVASALPALDEAEQAYALHLARLGRKRRLLIPLTAGLALLALVVGLVVVNRWDNSGLAAAAVFAAKPVAQTDESGYRLAVFQAQEDAGAGTITVWWAVSAPDLDAAGGEAIRPQLTVRGMGSAGWTDPAQTVVQPSQLGRYVGRSTFLTPSPRGEAVGVRFTDIGAKKVSWIGEAPLQRTGAYTSERTVVVDKELIGREQAVRVQTVTFAPGYTLVRYTGSTSLVNSAVLVLLNHDEPLHWLGKRQVMDGGDGNMEEIFAGMPAGAAAVQVGMAAMPLPLPATFGLRVDLSQPLSRVKAVHNGDNFSATIILIGRRMRTDGTLAAKLEVGDQSYPATGTWAVAENGEQQLLVTGHLPEALKPSMLTVDGLVPEPYPSFVQVAVPTRS